jgi:hypothetical protein
MSDELKSALEIAMERLDRELGVAPTLTDDQKDRIAAVRVRYEAKIAEQELAAADRRKQALAAGDWAKVEEVEARLVEERRRLEAARDRELEKVRSEPAV